MHYPLRKLILVTGAIVGLSALPLTVTESEGRVSLGVNDACAGGGGCIFEAGSLCPSGIPDAPPLIDYRS